MLIACWSAKGGVGTTVVAAALASVLARDVPEGCLLVDLAGDAPGALGLPEPSGGGLTAWLAAADVDLSAHEVPVSDRLALVPRGRGPLGPPARVEALAAQLAAEPRAVVVDAGVVSSAAAPVLPVVAGAARSLLVTRACYLGLRRAAHAPLRPSGVVLVHESGRALGAHDVEAVVGAPVVAEVRCDPAVARLVDAGLLGARLPRGLAASLADVA